MRGALDHCSDTGRQRWHLAGNGFGLAVQDGVNDGLITSAAERAGTAQHFVEYDAERPDVCPLVDLVSPRLLRTHVGNRTDTHTRLRYPDCAKLGQSEVDNFHCAICGQNYIGRLDVPMDYPLIGCFHEAATNLCRDVQCLRKRNRTLADALLERIAFVVLHGDIKTSIVCLTNLVNRTDVGVIQCRGSFGFNQKAFRRVRICEQVIGQDL